MGHEMYEIVLSLVLETKGNLLKFEGKGVADLD